MIIQRGIICKGKGTFLALTLDSLYFGINLDCSNITPPFWAPTRLVMTASAQPRPSVRRAGVVAHRAFRARDGQGRGRAWKCGSLIGDSGGGNQD